MSKGGEQGNLFPRYKSKKAEGKRMYYVTDYYTDEIITVMENLDLAIALSRETVGTQVETEDDRVVYTNIDLPF